MHEGLDLLTATAAILFGYLAGSIPFGLLLTRAAGLADVRRIGSGNIGATNVLRTGSKPIAAATLACDLLKGTVPVVVFYYIAGDPRQQGRWLMALGLAVLAIGIFITHRANIARLARGEESRIEFGKRPAQ